MSKFPTLSTLLADEGLRAAEFPVVKHSVFLAHAGVCPLPARVASAIHAYSGACQLGDQEDLLPANLLSETRALAARLIGATPEEISLVGPTSLALSFVAEGLPLQAGDNILISMEDYPSNAYPWMSLAAKGVEVRSIKTSEYGVIHPEDVERHLDANTRLVALASCHYISGHRLEHAAIGQLLRARGVWFCLDAIQTLGALPTDVAHVDFLAADAHKWLLGPCSAGLLYVRRELQPVLRPVAHGWHNIRCPGYVTQPALDYRPDGRRYEAGSHNLLGMVGLRESLRLLESLGREAIATELRRKRRWVVDTLRSRGFSILADNPDPERWGGMYSFEHRDHAANELHAALKAGGVAASLRYAGANNPVIRFSPHLYNTDAELQRALDLLPSR